MSSRSVLTLAVGNPYFIKLATNLARSFRLWNRHSNIAFWIVSDQRDLFPEDVKEWVNFLPVADCKKFQTFAGKLDIDLIAPADETLFIDADCLVYSTLDPLFDKFKGCPVGVIGEEVTEGESFGCIRSYREKLGLRYFVKFCGSVYFLAKGDRCSEVFAYARSLIASYRELGFIELNGEVNDEPLLGCAVAKFDLHPVEDDGLIKADRMCYKYCRSNVLTGMTHLFSRGEPPNPNLLTLDEARPMIIHFNACHSDGYCYRAESRRLELLARGWPACLANLNAQLLCLAPGVLSACCKNLLRPLYRAFFGVREIAQSPRIASTERRL